MVVDVIISFSRNEHLGEVSTRVRIAIDVILKEDGSGSEKRGISQDGKGVGDVWDAQDWSGGKGSVKGVEGFLLKRSPIPRLVFPGEKVERGDNMGEVGDEFAIEICKS